MQVEDLEGLKLLIASKDKIINDMKEKTKSYIQKLQQDHAEEIKRERDQVKLAQEKIESAKKFIAKKQDEETVLKSEIAKLVASISEYQNSAERDASIIKNLMGEMTVQSKAQEEILQAVRLELDASILKYKSLQETYDDLVNANNEKINELELLRIDLMATQEREQQLTSQMESLSKHTIAVSMESSPDSNDVDATDNLVASLRTQLVESMEQHRAALATKEADKSTLRKDIGVLKDSLASMEQQIRELQTENEKCQINYEKETNQLNTKISNLQETLETAHTELSSKDLERSLQSDEINKLQAALKDKDKHEIALMTQLRNDLQKASQEIETLALKSKADQEKLKQLEDNDGVIKGLQDTNRDLNSQLKSISAELEKLDKVSSQQKVALQSELNLTRKESEASKTLLVTAEAELAALRARFQTAEVQYNALETQRKELLHAKEELSSQLKQKSEALLAIEASVGEKEKAFKTQLNQVNVATKQRAAALVTDLDSSKSRILELQSELEELRRNMEAMGSANSVLQAQNDVLKVETDRLALQLHNANADTQDRKKKIKVYVDGLLSEKKAMEETLQSKESIIAQHVEKAEEYSQQIVVLENKLKTVKEQYEIELECQQREKKMLETQFVNTLQSKELEIGRLSAMVEESTRSVGHQVKDAKSKYESAKQEAEEHKAKRLAARNEIIVLSESLERTQNELQTLQNFLQYTLMPLVYEQVTNLENLLVNVEGATEHVTSKKSMQMQTKAKEFLEQRFRRSTGNRLGTMDESRRDGAGGELELGFRERSGHGAGPGGNGSGSVGSKGNGSRKGIQTGETMEKAESLKAELERVQAGLVLLGLSVDRLTDVVIVDNKCCGGIFNSLMTPAPIRKGYSSVSTTSLDNTDHGLLSGGTDQGKLSLPRSTSNGSLSDIKPSVHR